MTRTDQKQLALAAECCSKNQYDHLQIADSAVEQRLNLAGYGL